MGQGGVRRPFCAGCGRCSAASAARAGVVRRRESSRLRWCRRCQWPRGGWWVVGGAMAGWSTGPEGATSNRAAGRPACFSYNCCGAGSESDAVQRREAIWLSGYLKERRGWEERVDYELDAAHPRRSAGGLCELFSSRLGRGSEALGCVGRRSLRTMAPQLLFDGPAAKPRRPWGSY
jgi:hypothetical protein